MRAHATLSSLMLSLSLALAACAAPPAPPAPDMATRAAPVAAAPSPLDPAAVLSTPGRFAADLANDERRKAAEILAFMAPRPGATVVDLEAGGGYWTEILAHAVGPQGRVVMQNPAGFIPFVKETLDARFKDGRLSHVRQSVSPFDALDVPDAAADLVTWVQGPHEVFYKPAGGADLGDPVRSMAEVARILKPGGTLVVIDHSAVAGAPASVGNDLHRIDPARTIAMFEAAGLRLDARSEALANPADPRTASAFDPSIRGRTDQHVLRFVKPG
jgi:predicted methyltransferase